MTPATTLARPHALAVLLSRYVAGEIATEAVDAVCSLFEEVQTSPEERIAFTRFYLDALASGDLKALPTVAELSEILELSRA